MTEAAHPAFEVRGLSKYFNGTPALQKVDLAIGRGEIHGLLGENGSGKSTLIKVLAGYHSPDEGEILVNGQPVPLPITASEIRSHGFSFVHQDLGLLPELSVLENLDIVENIQGGFRRISWSRRRRRAAGIFESYELELNPDMKVGLLSPVQRALLAIVRAVENVRPEHSGKPGGNGLLVLDEPTVFLPGADVEHLFALVRRVAESRSSVLFVSHDLDEVMRITDKVTVLRDGKVRNTVRTAATSQDELIESIIGRKLLGQRSEQSGSTRGAAAAEWPLLEVRGLRGHMVGGVTFSVRPGEILGMTGLVGSGYEYVPYLIFGARRADAGELAFDGEKCAASAMSPSTALARGMALLPGNRQEDGGIGSVSVGENVLMQMLDDYFVGLRLRRGAMRRDANAMCEEYDVRPARESARYDSLSGGNQQKALLAKWLRTAPKLFIVHEPTQGVDIGAREQISQRLRKARDNGMSVLVAASDYEQLAELCDRVLIFGKGKVARVLSGDEISKERIAAEAYRVGGEVQAQKW